MFIIYDFIFFIFSLIYLPIYLLKGKFHRGFSARLGNLPLDLKLDQPIWIHAVSVGEALSIRQLVEGLRKDFGQKKFVISTVTATGNKIVRGYAQAQDFVTYLPLDFSFIVKRVISKVDPSLFILAETELWPNLIRALYLRNIPLVIVNARISDRSFNRYRLIKFLIKPVLGKINLFCCQAAVDAERLITLGASGDKVRVTGNMKFDTLDYRDLGGENIEARKKLCLDYRDKFWVAGSTHQGEEEIILGAYKELLKDYPRLRLLIAPRHPERARDIEKLLNKYRFDVVMVSQLASLPVEPANQPTSQPANQPTIFILDTIGELTHFYSIADIVFVGGSLVKKGGHNILEPTALGKPIISGPYMFNFRDIKDVFLRRNAFLLAHNQNELKEKIKYLLDNSEEAGGFILRAKEIIFSNQGATERNLEVIKDLFVSLRGVPPAAGRRSNLY
ncbi:MAG: 3-deoxy-D-manno-octulosonic acid transferase [Candidatus Omnitrophota bacterium]